MKRAMLVLIGIAAVLMAVLVGPAQAGSRPSPSPSLIGTDPVRIHSGTNFNMCLDVGGFSTDDNAAILHFECNGAANQVFHFEYRGLTSHDGINHETYRIVSNWSGKCLDVLNEETQSGARVVQKTCNDRRSQDWLSPSTNLNTATYFVNGNTIRGPIDNPRCLDVPGATTGRAQMQIWSCNDTPAQDFAPTP